MFLTGKAVRVICVGIRGWLYSRVLVRVDALAKVYCVFEFFTENRLARVPWHLQQEKAGVALGKKVVRWIVLVHYLLNTRERCE